MIINNSKFYSKLYDYLVKQQQQQTNLTYYARVNLNEENSKFIRKFYLIPLRNKDLSCDDKLKRKFSINVERNKNLILGVIVSTRVNLKNIDLKNINHIKNLLENEKNLYDFFLFYFGKLVRMNSRGLPSFLSELSTFLRNFEQLASLTDYQRSQLKFLFGDKLTGLTNIIASKRKKKKNKLYPH